MVVWGSFGCFWGGLWCFGVIRWTAVDSRELGCILPNVTLIDTRARGRSNAAANSRRHRIKILKTLVEVMLTRPQNSLISV